MTSNVCTVSSSSYPPSSDYYRVRSYAYINDNGSTSSVPRETGQFYLDSSKSINQQTTNAPSMAGNVVVDFKSTGSIEVCSLLVDSFNREYSIPEEPCTGGGYHPPLPPTPPPPDTSCSINNGNALSVSLGTLNRDEIPTVPDSGSAISKTVSVVCTGGTVSVNMQLNYTPIAIGSSQAVKTSANGVGAAIFYGSKALSPSDVTSVNFLEGSNTLTLGFQAVRDSTVALKDIPTGAFTASAVLVMTQQ